jgi:hypothetical protein
MALRDNPYLPLYVQDFLTDEKLNMCSPASQGIYIKMMCLFHKSEPYGGILLKHNCQQNSSTCYDFAIKLAKLLPFDAQQIEDALKELIEEGVLTVKDNFLFQKRMVRDNEISNKRADAGREGGLATAKHTANQSAKSIANTEYENENEYDIEVVNVYDDTITLFDEKFRPKTTKQKNAWMDVIDKLIRIDKHKPEMIIKVITWARGDLFWKRNFLSLLKLRDKNNEGIMYFDIFEVKSQSPIKTFHSQDNWEK